MNNNQLFGGSTARALLSTAGVVGSNYYFEPRTGKQLFSSTSLKRAGFQLVSSFAGNSLEGLVRPLLPSGSQISSMYLKPLLVGAGYCLLCKFVDSDRKYLMNFLISAGSEAMATYVEAPAEKLITGSLAPPVNRITANTRSSVLG